MGRVDTMTEVAMLTDEDYAKVTRWFERGELCPSLGQLLMDSRPATRCQVATAMRACPKARPLICAPFERRRIQSHYDVTRKVDGPTTIDVYEDPWW